MTDQSGKIIIAEACGLRRSNERDWKKGTWLKPDKDIPNGMPCVLPDYGNSLDAMQKAVLMQDEEFQIRFEEALEERRKFFNPWKMFHQLTATDWSKAFVETLKQLKRV